MAKPTMAFETQICIHFDDADPAGICFFGNVFSKIHGAYEEYVEALGQDTQQWFLSGPLAFPIRHTDAEFLAPLRAMETYSVKVQPLKISGSTFQLKFLIHDGERSHCEVTTTHVALDKATFKKATLPEGFASAIQQQIP